MVIMGRVVAAFGILGHLKVKTASSTVDALVKYTKQPLIQVNKHWQRYTVTQHAITPPDVLQLKLAEVNNRDQALMLKGALIAITEEELPKLKHDEYYYRDLMGLSVNNQRGEYLGVVSDCLEPGAAMVLMIKNTNAAQQYLIPFVNQYVLQVDLANKQIIVDWELDCI